MRDDYLIRSAGPEITVHALLQSSQLNAARSTTMSEASQSSSSLSSTTTPSSVPSPALSTLSLTDLKEVSDEDRQEAVRLKADANKAFLGMLSKLAVCLLSENCVWEGHDFTRAAQLYSTAIKHNPGDATLFCNRAYTRIKLEEHGYALHDAGKCQRSSLRFEKIDALP